MTLTIPHNTYTQLTPDDNLIIPDDYIQAITEATKNLAQDDANSFLTSLVYFLDPYDNGSGNDTDYTLSGNIADIFKNAGLGNTAEDVQRVLSDITAPYATHVFEDSSNYTMPYPKPQPYIITGNTGTPDYINWIDSIIGNVNSTGNNALQVVGAMSSSASEFSNINAQGLNALLGYSVGFENANASASTGNVFGGFATIF
jgi:hypothetical protein